MTAPDLTLSAKRLPPAHIERLNKAMVVPVQKGSALASGVARADGSFCEMSRTQISGGRLTGLLDTTGMAPAETLTGRWLFAGIGRHHFGHFLVETLIRLWATGYYREELDGLIIIPRHGHDFSGRVAGDFGKFLSMLTDDLPVKLITQPTEVQTLLLPSPGFGHLAWLPGTPVFRRELRGKIATCIQPGEAQRVYISRTGLEKDHMLVDQEAQIEDLMRKAGYAIFHPERHTIAEQLACYAGARIVVGADGSAFHLLPFAMPQSSYAAIYQRRHFDRAFKAYPSQLESFAEAEVTSIRCAHPRKAGAAKQEEAFQLDFEKLKDGLFDAGFI